MTTPPTSEGPEVAASEPSQPIAPQKNEQENAIMTHKPDNPHPVDSTYFACCRAIGNHAPGCPLLALERLRSAVAEVDPAQLTAKDTLALFDLIQAAYESDSVFGRAIREADAARKKHNAEAVQ